VSLQTTPQGREPFREGRLAPSAWIWPRTFFKFTRRRRGRADLQSETASSRVLRFFEKLPPCLVGLEACGGSHYWAREIAALGHDVRLIPPVYVKPYVKTRKDRRCDAEAISEAVTRKTMRFVPIKSADQQAAVMLLKHSTLLVRQQIRRSTRFAAFIGVGRHSRRRVTKVKALIEIVRTKRTMLPKAARLALTEIADQIEALTRQIDKLERGIVARRSATRTCGC